MPRLPDALQREGRRLLHQQCWLWGQDIKRAEGNLLLEHGFERVRPPEGVAGSSQYTLRLAEGRVVRLWGFGLYFATRGGTVGDGIFLNRFEFTPRRAQGGDVWQAQDLREMPRADDLRTVAEAVEWLAHFEQAVLLEQGRAYRERCLIGWDAASVRAEEFPRAWEALAVRIRREERLRSGRGPGALRAVLQTGSGNRAMLP